MTTEDDFIAALDANPDDWQTRLVFADWLQERGDQRAEGYRALGQLRRSPGRNRSGVWYFDWNSDENWIKHLPKEGRSSSKQDAHTLPQSWVERIEGGKHPEGGFEVKRPTRREVEDATALGFTKLTAKRRAKLLAACSAG